MDTDRLAVATDAINYFVGLILNQGMLEVFDKIRDPWTPFYYSNSDTGSYIQVKLAQDFYREWQEWLKVKLPVRVENIRPGAGLTVLADLVQHYVRYNNLRGDVVIKAKFDTSLQGKLAGFGFQSAECSVTHPKATWRHVRKVPVPGAETPGNMRAIAERFVREAINGTNPGVVHELCDNNPVLMRWKPGIKDMPEITQETLAQSRVDPYDVEKLVRELHDKAPDGGYYVAVGEPEYDSVSVTLTGGKGEGAKLHRSLSLHMEGGHIDSLMLAERELLQAPAPEGASCTSCGRKLEPSWRFCMTCGART